MQELSKFSLKINVITNGLEKYTRFILNNKLSFIDSFQFLSSSLDSLVEDLSKHDFKYFSQEFEIEIKRKMLSQHQLKIADLWNITIDKSYCFIFLIKKSMCFIMKTYNFS